MYCLFLYSPVVIPQKFLVSYAQNHEKGTEIQRRTEGAEGQSKKPFSSFSVKIGNFHFILDVLNFREKK